MLKNIRKSLLESADLKKQVAEKFGEIIEQAINLILISLKNGSKVLLMGNGGSAADAQHIAGELIGRFKLERNSIPAIALTTDTSILTSIGNDYGFDRVFERQIESLGCEGDIVIAISTSGNSKNVIEALKKSKKNKMKSIGLLGSDGGQIKQLVDLPIVVPSSNTPRIQETHITIGHIICEEIEKELFK
ncbi:MAG: D-sedoheptulose 7-phosphate isomerase [Nitrospinota bacterium]|jgi:D-sedoheptulose 7-phosphate isomerase|nr:D-sedoheptulose 7-phosphate isomerase [Nitrospinota bacterium]MDP7580816.1 D-sedoheptulose 7-phosphate isomerase [Nitrospinota bacterium]HJN03372.1 D-sedoheptulose 7-phosphate isomerase [Nitrospinota bacterium]